MTEEELKALDQLYINAEEEMANFREACLSCAYNDEGSCFCSERESVLCPYAEEVET